MTIRWRPILTAEDIIVSIISLLQDPNINSPANIDASVTYKLREKHSVQPFALSLSRRRERQAFQSGDSPTL